MNIFLKKSWNFLDYYTKYLFEIFYVETTKGNKIGGLTNFYHWLSPKIYMLVWKNYYINENLYIYIYKYFSIPNSKKNSLNTSLSRSSRVSAHTWYIRSLITLLIFTYWLSLRRVTRSRYSIKIHSIFIHIHLLILKSRWILLLRSYILILNLTLLWDHSLHISLLMLHLLLLLVEILLLHVLKLLLLILLIHDHLIRLLLVLMSLILHVWLFLLNTNLLGWLLLLMHLLLLLINHLGLFLGFALVTHHVVLFINYFIDYFGRLISYSSSSLSGIGTISWDSLSSNHDLDRWIMEFWRIFFTWNHDRLLLLLLGLCLLLLCLNLLLLLELHLLLLL